MADKKPVSAAMNDATDAAGKKTRAAETSCNSSDPKQAALLSLTTNFPIHGHSPEWLGCWCTFLRDVREGEAHRCCVAYRAPYERAARGCERVILCVTRLRRESTAARSSDYVYL